MKYKALTVIVIAVILMDFNSNTKDLKASKQRGFNVKKDLLLVQFDCKTDVDDLHTIAALETVMSNSKFSKINYHAVAGTYGIQKGLYVPANDLFQLAFGDNWTDADENFQNAIEKVKNMTLKTLKGRGHIWIAEAGQSDFTAELIKQIQLELPKLNVSKRIHVVQHGGWNEKQTSVESLEFVKEQADYHKIADGNKIGNGTPGFSDPDYTNWKAKITNPKSIEVWQLATDLSNKYNGKEKRHNNKAISAGGLDFSDFVEVAWILKLKNIDDTEQFFNVYSN